MAGLKQPCASDQETFIHYFLKGSAEPRMGPLSSKSACHSPGTPGRIHTQATFSVCASASLPVVPLLTLR